VTWEAVGGIIFGWLLGLLTPSIRNVIETRRRENEVRVGILTELKDLRLRLASAVGSIERHYGRIDRELLNWVISILAADADSEGKSELEAYQEIAKYGDADLVTLFQKEGLDRAHLGLNVKKYRVPYLDSKIGELGIFDEKTRAGILGVRAKLDLFNADVDEVLHYQKLTFELEDTEDRAGARRNFEKFTKNLAKNGRFLSDRIGRITDAHIVSTVSSWQPKK
jgi:hypothetical protein